MLNQKIFREGLSLALIPIIILVFSILLKTAAGPYWLGANSDPAYLYLINSLYLIEGLTPSFVDHPGTTLQLLGAAVIKVLNLGADTNQTVENVLINPEYYLNGIYFLMLGLAIASLFFLGVYAYKKSKNLLFALLLQSGAFTFLILKSYSSGDYILPVAANVFAESLFPLIDNLFMLGVLLLFFSHKKKNHYGGALLFGMVSALGVVTKVSFAPLLIIPFLIIRGIKAKFFFVGVFMLSSFILTLAILPEYKEMFNYIYLFQANKGFHGTGGIGFMAFHEIFANALFFFKQQLFLFVCLLAGIFFLIGVFVFRGRIDWQKDLTRRAVFYPGVLLIGIFLQAAFVLKHPAPHYAAPAIGLAGALLAFLFFSLQKVFDIKKRYGYLALTLIVLGFSFRALIYQHELRKRNTEDYQFSQAVSEKYKDCIICHHYRSSSVAYALYFGDDCKGRHRAFFDRLKILYPKSLVWNRWDYTFHHFSDQVSEESLISAGPCLLLYGTKMDFSISYINAEPIESSADKFVYKVVSSHRKEAMETFLLAKAFEIRRDYQRALIFAMRSKQLGFPHLRVDRYIEELTEKINAK